MKNSLTLNLRISGDSGHGSRPELIQQHAIYTSLDILDRLRSLLSDEHSMDVQLFTTDGRNSANQFPASCDLKLVINNIDNQAQQRINTFLDQIPQLSRI